jgi:hypothetical protein
MACRTLCNGTTLAVMFPGETIQGVLSAQTVMLGERGQNQCFGATSLSYSCLGKDAHEF